MSQKKRVDNRLNNQLRKTTVTRHYLSHKPGSVFIEFGNTKVLVVVTVQTGVPGFKKGSGEGWLTAEYSMLPGCSDDRIRRERNKVSGRTYEIQRLIGRSMRMAVDLKKLGEVTVMIDCDVIQADGGTRTASITGASIALEEAVKDALKNGTLDENPIINKIGAISVGVVKGEPMLDLCYIEDSTADVDMNMVMTDSGKIVEIQGTGEEAPFDKDELDVLYTLAKDGIDKLFLL
jgi:ribonuclease PH